MKTVSLIQGTPEWAAHRARHWNASDAPAMLGVSPYKTRAQLLRELATGVSPEIDPATQRRFEDGHRYEALARPLAEQIIGEELFPCVGVTDCGRYSASFDGLTLMGDTVFEHKSLNDELRHAMRDGMGSGAELPEIYCVQMEQQCMVSGAERVLFMASKWDGEDLLEMRRCWYTPNPDLRRRIIAGWQQFEADLAAYAPEPAAAPVAAGRAPDQLPALHIELTGMVTESNLAEFRDRAIQVFQGISTDLQTDQDFANAEQTVKWCKDIEDRLKGAKDHALSQTASIDELFRAIDAISAEARTKRLQLDKLVSRRKDEIRAEIVQRGVDQVGAHYRTINATLGEFALQVPATVRSDLAQAIKGRKTVASLNDAIDAAVADMKIDASQTAERVRANIAVMCEAAADHEQLFADRRMLVASKSPEDLRNLIAARIAEHRQREEARLEQERERIRREEAERLERERQATNTTERAIEVVQPSSAADGGRGDFTGELRAAGEPGRVIAKPPTSTARIKLGEINAAIAPLTITASGLAALGFKPVGTQGAAQLYALSEFPDICAAIAQVIATAPDRAAQKQAA